MNKINYIDIEERKRLIRKQVKDYKLSLKEDFIEISSKTIFQTVERIPEFINAKTVLAYWSLPDEVYTHSFVLKWCQKKQILLPLVVGTDLELRLFEGKELLVQGTSFGIMEPHGGKKLGINTVDFAIIPGVAFDLSGNRLGRGKGYYDKLFVNNSIYKVGVCFHFQVFPRIPVNKHDIPVDRVVFS